MSKLSLRAELSSPSSMGGRQASLLAEVWQQQGSAGIPIHQRVRVPVASGTRDIEVAPGQVRIQLRLPSGALYNEERTVESGVDQEVVFHLEKSAHEWLSWHRYLDRRPEGTSARTRSASVGPREGELATAEGRSRGVRGFEALPVEAEGMAAPAAPEATLGLRLAATGRLELVTDVDGTRFRADLAAILEGGSRDTEHLVVRVDTDEQTLSLTFEPRLGGFDRHVRHLLHLALPGNSMLLPLPLPWMGPASTGHQPVPVQLILTPGVEEEEEGNLQKQVIIQDADFGPLLAYFQAGDRAAARSYEDDLARLAKEAMASDQTNPIPALAGAYVLLRLGRLDYVREWLEILAATAPFADGPILVATALLADARQPGSRGAGGPLDRAAAALLDASSRGLPLFAPGVSLLRDGLRLASVRLRGENPSLAAQLGEALKRAGRLTEVVRPGSFFVCLEGEAKALAEWLPVDVAPAREVTPVIDVMGVMGEIEKLISAAGATIADAEIAKEEEEEEERGLTR